MNFFFCLDKLEYQNGYFDLGSEYQDKCDRDNCMALLTIQVFVLLLIKPLPRFLYTVIWPYVYFLKRKLRFFFWFILC